MRIVVTGVNGLLGQRIVGRVPREVEIFGCDLQNTAMGGRTAYRRADIAMYGEISGILRKVHPDWVINTAAITDVDRCETDRELAWRVNVIGVENVVRACEEVNAGVIQLSTDYVFDGENGPYTEEDTPNPIGYYGLTKRASEERVQSSSVRGLVIRTMVLYGYAPGVRLNFVMWLLEKLSSGERVRIVTDQWGNPTFADDLATLLFRCASESLTGVFHAAGSEFISRYDMALRAAQVFGYDPDLIRPICTDELGQRARRPLRSGLRIDKLEAALNTRMRGLNHGLRCLRSQMIGCDRKADRRSVGHV